MYQVDVLTPNAPDSADDRPHVHRIDLLDGGVLELGDKHLDLVERDCKRERLLHPVPVLPTAHCTLTARHNAVSGGKWKEGGKGGESGIFSSLTNRVKRLGAFPACFISTEQRSKLACGPS